MTLVMFIWNIDSFKIIFVKDIFERENCLFEIHFLTKFWSKVVFRKDDFEKYKNFGHKVFFRKIIFTFKSVFHKDNFERVHISNKHHKSHVWPKNLKKKKKKKHFLATLALWGRRYFHSDSPYPVQVFPKPEEVMGWECIVVVPPTKYI